MRPSFSCAIAAAFAVELISTSSVRAQTAQTLFSQITDYRFFTSRRQNDVMGVESVFDDYRKNWLSRSSSTIQLGLDSRNPQSDTPACVDSSIGTVSKEAGTLCGNGHVVRGDTSFFAAKDTRNGGDIREGGNLSYVGYENMLTNNLFLGSGVSGAVSEIKNNAGQGVNVGVAELTGHLIGGYKIGNDDMVLWNVSYARSFQETRRGSVTGDFNTYSVLVTGVWYHNVMLTQTAYVSLGLDYTLEITRGGNFVESDGTVHAGLYRTSRQWQGDFTPSALFVQPFKDGELFARIGANIDTLNTKNPRQVDVPIDIGGSFRLNNRFVLTSSLGTTLARSDYSDVRAMLRITGRP